MTTASKSPRPKTALKTLKPSQIRFGEHNPRAAIDQDSESFRSLVASLADVGVLQPVLVGPADGGKHLLIAGERRVRAAKAARLSAIPALIAEHLSGRELLAAVIENTEREDLSPIEEAESIRLLQEAGGDGHGLTQPQVAKALNRSERWVRDRLVLLKLPDAVQPAFDGGEIPLEAARNLQRIGSALPAAAEALVSKVTGRDPEFEANWLASDEGVAQIMRSAVHGNGRKAPLADQVLQLGLHRGLKPAELPVSAAIQRELKKALDELGPTRRTGFPSERDFQFGKDDIDAARSYGCLLEISAGGHGAKVTDYYATDPDWIADRCRQKVVEQREAVEKDKANAAAVDKDKPVADLTGPEKRERERIERERKREREKEAKEKAEAYDANVALGLNLAKKLARIKMTPDIARLLALLVLDPDGRSMARRGLPFIREDLHTVVEDAAGGIRKVEPNGDAYGALVAAFEKAKTPDAMLGALLTALISAHFAEDRVAVKSQQVGYTVPGTYGGGLSSEIPALLERIADDAGVLPDRMKKAAQRKARERAGRES